MERRFNAKPLILQILSDMPSEKKKVLKKSLERNDILTSTKSLEHATLYNTRHGYLVELTGCRCKFSVYMNNDMEYTRKPNCEEIIAPVNGYYVLMNESDYLEINI